MRIRDVSELQFSLFDWLVVIIVGSGIFLSIFDALRKTTFVNASWNYTYQYWNFVYNYPAFILLSLFFLLIIVTASKWMTLPSNWFVLALLLSCTGIFTLALFALPLELTRALALDKRGLYNGGVYLIEHGLLDFLRSFNTLPQTAPANEDLFIHSFDITQENIAANAFAQWISGLDWLPFNETFANYVGVYTAQKHGPVSVLFIVPFLVLLGSTTTAALAGSVIIASLIPVIGYYTFRLYFDEYLSRIGAVLVGIAPGLFIWTRGRSPVPYDIITGFLIACCIYAFLQGIKSDRSRFFSTSGIFLALATMTKFTGFVIVLPIAIVLFTESSDLSSFLTRGGTVLSSWGGVVLIFLLAGYNAFAQWLYTAYKTTLYKIHLSSPETRAVGSPADVLNNNLLAPIGTLYNARWMNIVLLLLAIAFVTYTLYKRDVLNQRRHIISAALLTAFLPFAVWVVFSAGTLSRHTIMLIVPLGFAALSGLSVTVEWSDVLNSQLLRFCQISLFVGALQFLINI